MIKENKLEIIFKGIANKNRIKILLYLYKNPESTIGELAKIIKLNIRTTSDHIIKMTMAGLIMKRHESLKVKLALTERGKNITKYIKILN